MASHLYLPGVGQIYVVAHKEEQSEQSNVRLGTIAASPETLVDESSSDKCVLVMKACRYTPVSCESSHL